jgi:hypothetical protein
MYLEQNAIVQSRLKGVGSVTSAIKWLSFVFLLSVFFATEAKANTITAASCKTSDVQTAINAASDGDTVVIPNGSCTWSTGITTSKQISLQGESVGGVTITDANPNGCNPCTAASSLLHFHIGNSFHTTIANLQFLPGTASGDYIVIDGTGLVPLMHDMYFRLFQFQMFDAVQWDVTGGVIWNTTFESTDPTNSGTGGCLVINQPSSPVPWDSPSTMGMADTTGTSNVYIEDSTFNLVDQCPDVSDNGRVVMRHVTMNGSSGLTHGSTGAYGGRHVELYDSTFLYPQLNPPRAMNRYFWWRAGTGVITGNSIQWINSQAYPNKPTWAFTAENAQRPATHGCCVGYMCFHQTGSGSDGVKHSPTNTPPAVDPTTGLPVPAGQDLMQISEPLYSWNNSGTGDGAAHVGFVDGQPNDCNTAQVPVNPATGQTWSSVDLILFNRDIFFDAGAKPGWTRYTYPHPLRGAGSGPTPPMNLGATVQ